MSIRQNRIRQLILRETHGPRTNCPRGTCDPRTSCPGGTTCPRIMHLGGQFKAGTSHPMTPAKISVWEIRKISPLDHNFKFWSTCERVRVRVNTVAVGCHFLVVYVENCATYFSAIPFLHITSAKRVENCSGPYLVERVHVFL